jgi:hypothetical protein
MALYGVLADINGNLEALRAALGALERRGVRRLVCLGDVVGCNADPDACVALARSRCWVTLAGKHDLISIGRLDFAGCSVRDEYSLRRTRRELSAESRAWLAGLPASQVLEDGVVLVHDAAPDRARLLLSRFPEARVCFFGQGHERKVYEVIGDAVRDATAPQVPLAGDSISFVHPGSVDASRKRGPKAAECAIFDSRSMTVEFLHAPYDGAAVEAKAAVFGYRINELTDRMYTLRRRTASAARRIGQRLARAAHTGR